MAHYPEERNHQGLDNTLIRADPVFAKNDEVVQCRQRLRGILAVEISGKHGVVPFDRQERGEPASVVAHLANRKRTNRCMKYAGPRLCELPRTSDSTRVAPQRRLAAAHLRCAGSSPLQGPDINRPGSSGG